MEGESQGILLLLLLLLSNGTEVYLMYLIRLGLGCPGSPMSLYGPTLHATPIDSCIGFQRKINISCIIMSCGNKLKN